MVNKINNKIAFAIPVIAALIIRSLLIIASSNSDNIASKKHISATTNDGCLPKTMVAINSTFHIREPEILPQGYKLQAVEDLGHIDMYYSNQTLCPLVGGPDKEVKRGTLILIISPNPDLVNGIAEAIKTI